MRRVKVQNHEIDRPLLVSVLILIVIGLVMISSAGIIYSQTRFGDPYYFFKHQLFYGILPGLLGMYLAQKIDYHYWRKVALPLFGISVIFLVLVFVPGIGMKVYGAMRWIDLGPISFQPSEMVKFCLIIYLAAWLENKGTHQVKDFFESFVPFLGIIGLAGILILKQPDMGTLGVLILIAVSIYFVSGARLSHLTLMGVFGSLMVFMLVKLEPYRFNRILAFLNRSDDPQGIGYQINQALLAVGSGGIFGLGLGYSRQKFNYLPEPVGDSIFAIIGEELGIIGATFLIVLFLIIAFRGFRIVKNAPDEFGCLLAVGITVWIVTQAFVNIAANVALIPLTGIPLPFVSYGGTSLIFLMFAVGVLLNISKQAHKK